MRSNIADQDIQPKVQKCSYCFQVLAPKKVRNRVNRKIVIEGVEHYGYVCDARCGELWQDMIRRDYERMMAFALNG